LGLRLDFSEGPKIDPPLTPDKVPFLVLDLERLEPVIEAIRLLDHRLEVPLIGFCGGPLTVASYLIEGGLDAIKQWVYRCPEILDALFEKIADVSIAYLRRQIDAGADVLQIFDSWANVLSREHFQRFCLPYYQRMIQSVDAPVFLFMRGLALYLDDLRDLPCALSLDWQVPLAQVRCKTNQTLQGNLDPDLLFAPRPVIQQKAKELLASMKGDCGFIAGLGHGVKPDVPLEAVQCLVQSLQSHSLPLY